MTCHHVISGNKPPFPHQASTIKVTTAGIHVSPRSQSDQAPNRTSATGSRTSASSSPRYILTRTPQYKDSPGR
ncbi:uncharacterized protein AKAW2_30258S [Aspergillus luchuensis]|uniref:Uncharacterized protein n=1 Tax=Aspergillus kawachii TaxID=1069201 RepID=A0A7R7W6H6_ASPKA|nr:uncharacterized protein AKAW2_30258S [Aspergillus luchuensis]BCR96939.1 hypothetical protein AKAW2_30258S [Aspergillus luchuensis]